MKAETVDWLLAHASSAYQAQRDAADKIKDRVTFVSGLLLTPLSGAIVFLANGFRGPMLDEWNALLFAVPLGIAGALVIFSICIVLRMAVKGYAYAHLPLPSQLSQYANAHPNPDAVLTDLKGNMLSRYESAVDHNSAQNRKRSSGLLKAASVAVLAIPFAAIAALRYEAVAIVSGKEPIEIAIVKDLRPEEKRHEQREATRAESTDQPAAKGTQSRPEATDAGVPAKHDD